MSSGADARDGPPSVGGGPDGGPSGQPRSPASGGLAGPPEEPPDTEPADPADDRPLRRWARSLAVASAVVLLLAGVLYWFSPALARWADGLFPRVLFRADARERAVALTVDDAPSAATAEILDVLARHDARATFFVIGGRTPGRGDVLRRIVREGHELGNHLMEDRPSWRLHPDELRLRIEAAGRRLSAYDTVRWLRPGGGWFDDDLLRVAREEGYRVALGSVYPLDAWLPWPGLLAAFVRRKVRPGDVVVLHDGPVRGPRTAEVLRRVLPALRARGYRVVTLSELAPAPPGRGAAEYGGVTGAAPRASSPTEAVVPHTHGRGAP